ncbi:MAG: long-chain fatty acid--CoA ligase, partial [Candidatus Dadabacteria bacterium]
MKKNNTVQTVINKADTAQSIPELFCWALSSHQEQQVYFQCQRGKNNQIKYLGKTYQETAKRISSVQRFLKITGVGAEDKVAILSQTRPEWLEADLAVLFLGAVVVSVYPTLTAQEVGYILYDSGADIVFAENKEQLEKLFWLEKNEFTIPPVEERKEKKVKLSFRAIITFEDTEAKDERVTSYLKILSTIDPVSLIPPNGINRDSLACLVYTSGTTGPPKGVMQTHGNHLANIRQAWQSSLVWPSASIFLMLPLAHSFAKLMGYLGFTTAVTLKLPSIADKSSSKINVARVMQEMPKANAEIIPLVPRILEKIKQTLIDKSKRDGFKNKLLSLTLKNAEVVYQTKLQGKKPALLQRLLFFLFSFMRKEIKKSIFGAKLVSIVSGGAKLNPSVAHFFESLGITVLQGYGLTETCVATNVNRLNANKIGTVGPVLSSDIEMKIAADGEILFKGPNIACGYYNRKQATEKAWDKEGWFHTGDLGFVDDDGYLTIVGRKKDLIVTSYGKNVAPEEIEQKLTSSPLISQAVMIGDGRPYCTALIVINKKAVEN